MPCLSGGIKDPTGNCDLRVKIPPRAPGRKPKQLHRPHTKLTMGKYAILWVNRSKERAVHSKTDTGSNPARPKTMRLFLLSKESHTPFLKGCPMTSSPDNNNIPCRKPQRILLLYRRNRNSQHKPTFKQNHLFLPMVPGRRTLRGIHNCISRITMPARSANRGIRFME